MDEESHAAHRRQRRCDERSRRKRYPGDVAEQHAAERRAGRERHEEDDAHGGEGVDGVVQHLREETDPQHLEREAGGPGSRGDAEQAERRRRRGADEDRRPAADGERHQARERARRRRGAVARPDADRDGQPEAHGGDAERAAERVQRVEETASPADGAGQHQRVADCGQRRPEAHGGGQDGDADRRDAACGAGRRERALRRRMGEHPEDRERP